MIHFLKKGEWNRRFDSGPRLHSLKYWHSVGLMAIFSLKWQQKWQQVWLYLSMFWVVYFYTKQGAGGLVFQDRCRLDRLTHMRNFSQCRKWGFFQKMNVNPYWLISLDYLKRVKGVSTRTLKPTNSVWFDAFWYLEQYLRLWRKFEKSSKIAIFCYFREGGAKSL